MFTGGEKGCIGNKCVNFTELTRHQGYRMCYIMYYNVIIYVYNKNDYTWRTPLELSSFWQNYSKKIFKQSYSKLLAKLTSQYWSWWNSTQGLNYLANVLFIIKLVLLLKLRKKVSLPCWNKWLVGYHLLASDIEEYWQIVLHSNVLFKIVMLSVHKIVKCLLKI